MKRFEIDLVENQKLLPIYLRQQNDRCISHIKQVVKEVKKNIYIYIIFCFGGGGRGGRLQTKRLVPAIFPYNTNAGLYHPSLLKQISLVARANGLCACTRGLIVVILVLTTWDWRLISLLYWWGIWAGTMFANCWKYLQCLVKIRRTRITNTSFSWACSSGDGMNVELSKSMTSFMGSLSFKFQSRTRLS